MIHLDSIHFIIAELNSTSYESVIRNSYYTLKRLC